MVASLCDIAMSTELSLLVGLLLMCAGWLYICCNDAILTSKCVSPAANFYARKIIEEEIVGYQ